MPFTTRSWPSVSVLALLCSIAEGFNNSNPTTARVNFTGTRNSTLTLHPTSLIRDNGTISLNTTSAFTTLTPSNQSTIDPIASCNTQWNSYSTASRYGYKSVGEQTFTKVIISTQTIPQTTYTCSSTCGDVCYADVTTLATDYSTITSTSYSVSTKWEGYNGTAPNCTIPSSSCVSLWEDFASSTQAWLSWYGYEVPWYSEPPWPMTPGCKYCKQRACYVEGSGQVQIYYFPEPTTVVRDMCTESPTAGPLDPWRSGNFPNTSHVEITTGSSVVLDGRTFYQGNVYLSVQRVYATNNCGSTLGKVYSDIMLTLASNDLYSGRNDLNTVAGVFPINYADFNPPYPWSAYRGALRDCASGMNFNTGPWCAKSVVFEDNFHPVIQLPIRIQHLDPTWAGCKPIVALVDPPVALSSAVFLPTSTNAPPGVVPTAARPEAVPKGGATQTPGVNPDPNGNRPGLSPSKATAGSGADPGLATVAPVITVGSTIIPVAPNGGGLVMQPEVTVPKGGSGVVVDGTTIQLGADHVTIKSPAGTTSVPLRGQYKPSEQNAPVEQTSPSGQDSPFELTIGSRTFALDPNGNLIAPGTTLGRDDPPMTMSGNKVISLEAKGITIMDSQTGKIKFIAFADLKNEKLVRIGDEMYILNDDGSLILGPGTTLRLGDAPVTISGIVVSIGTAGVNLVDPDKSTTILTRVDFVSKAEGDLETTPEAQQKTKSAEQESETTESNQAVATTSKKGNASRSQSAAVLKAISALLIWSLWAW